MSSGSCRCYRKHEAPSQVREGLLRLEHFLEQASKAIMLGSIIGTKTEMSKSTQPFSQESLRLISAGCDIAAAPCPVSVEMLASRSVDALVSVGAKEVALGLDQVGG